MKQSYKFKLRVFYKTTVLDSLKISDMNVRKRHTVLLKRRLKNITTKCNDDSWLDPRLKTGQKLKNKTKCYQVHYWDIEKYEYR